MNNAQTLKTAAALLAAALCFASGGAELDVGNGANDNIYADSAAYAAATKIVKTGTGKTTINFGQKTAPAFSGEIEVKEGTLAIFSIPNLGKPTKITVSDGATLDLTTSDTESAYTALNGTEIIIEGTGDGGAGALVRGGVGVNFLFRTLTLAGNATIAFNTQTGLGISGSSTTYGAVNLNGHTLTKTGSGKFYCSNVGFYGADGTTADPGHLVIAAGALFLHNGKALPDGSEKNTITLKHGTSLQLRNTNPIKWKIIAEGDATILDDDSTVTTGRNRIDGSLSFAGDATLTAQGGTIPANARLTFQDNKVSFAKAMTARGPGQVSFNGADVSFANPARITAANANVATINVADGTKMTGLLNSDGYGQTRFYIGNSENTRGVVTVSGDETIVKNFSLSLGEVGYGALYQRGGATSWVLGANGFDRFGYATGAYGYIGVTGGRFSLDTAKKDGAYIGWGGTAVLASHGGTADVFNSTNAAFAWRNGGRFVYWQDNGAINTFDKGLDLGDLNNRNYAGHADITVSGNGSELFVNGAYGLRFLWSNAGASAMVNLIDGGALRTWYLYRVSNAYNWYLNLNGGVIKPARANAQFSFSDDATRRPTASTVYEGGFIIDTSDSLNANGAAGDAEMQLSFVAPGAGQRVASIALPTAAGFASEKIVGPPLVTITGDGAGASAFARFDDTTRTVKQIVVTSPGWGYTTATATLSSGGLSASYDCAVTLEDQPTSGWKGFTKRGAQRLNMHGVNTFKGDVTVAEGILGFLNTTAAQGGLPAGAGVTIAEGALLTFPTADTAVSVPFLAGCGTVSYGTVTVTDRIECKAADIFAGKHLTANQGLMLADGVKIVVTDPENLVNYRKSGAATVVTVRNGKNIVRGGGMIFAFGTSCETERLDTWKLSATDTAIRLLYANGTTILLR